MTAPTAELASIPPGAATNLLQTAARSSLPTYRLNIMRAGYLLMAVGLAAIKWPYSYEGMQRHCLCSKA